MTWLLVLLILSLVLDIIGLWIIIVLALRGSRGSYIINHCPHHGMWRTPVDSPTGPCPRCVKEA